MVYFEIQGDAKLIGVGNGDQLSTESFQVNQRKAFNGKCLAIIRIGKNKGKVKITATSVGLKKSEVTILNK